MVMDIHISSEHLLIAGKILFLMLGAALFVTKLIDALVKTGKIESSQAGEVNQALSFAIALIALILKWIGMDGEIPAVEMAVVEAAAMLLTTAGIAVFAKLWHWLVNWLNGVRRPKLAPPAALGG
jgi:hypothetical protein